MLINILLVQHSDLFIQKHNNIPIHGISGNARPSQLVSTVSYDQHFDVDKNYPWFKKTLTKMKRPLLAKSALKTK